MPSTVTIDVPPQYGYVILVAVSSVFVLLWKARRVGIARTEHNVPYPTMYSPDNVKFNCVQRAHQNTLEIYPLFITFLLLGGLIWPIVSSVAGVVFLVGRVHYALGYYTGDPKKRERGRFGTAGLLTLLIATVRLSFYLICTKSE